MEPNPVSSAPQSPMPAAQPARPAPSVQEQTAHTPARQLVLSLSLTTRSDISRCLREIEQLDDYFHQASIRGGQAKDLPKLSLAMENLAADNSLNLLLAPDRAAVKDFLTRLRTKAPVVHVSFPSEASNDFIQKLLEWFRREVHPHVVLHIGLQPELAAGCMVRTTNKVFDFSFRKRFEKSKQKLIAALEASA